MKTIFLTALTPSVFLLIYRPIKNPHDFYLWCIMIGIISILIYFGKIIYRCRNLSSSGKNHYFDFFLLYFNILFMIGLIVSALYSLPNNEPFLAGLIEYSIIFIYLIFNIMVLISFTLVKIIKARKQNKKTE